MPEESVPEPIVQPEPHAQPPAAVEPHAEVHQEVHHQEPVVESPAAPKSYWQIVFRFVGLLIMGVAFPIAYLGSKQTSTIKGQTIVSFEFSVITVFAIIQFIVGVVLLAAPELRMLLKKDK